jgi:hypothetical protein
MWCVIDQSSFGGVPRRARVTLAICSNTAPRMPARALQPSSTCAESSKTDKILSGAFIFSED